MLDKFPGSRYMVGSLLLMLPSIFLFGSRNGLLQILLIVTTTGALILGMKGAKISRESLRDQQNKD